LKARRFLRWTILVSVVISVVVLIPHLVGAQTPEPRLPGDIPEASKPYATWWLSWLVFAGAAGLALVLGFAYWRLSSRFYGRDEPPPQRPRPRFAGMAAAQPMAAAPQGAASAQPGAAAAARADATSTQVKAPSDSASPPAEAPAAEAAAATTKAEAPAEKAAAEQPADEKPAGEKPAEPVPEKAPAAAAGGHVEPDQETFDRVLQEQLDKGVDRRVAEGRAKAAAVRAAREKASAG
jgi:hypothetical protein